MHLSRFANDEGQVCVYQKNQRYRWTSVSKTAVERDYHEYTIGDKKSNFSVEGTLSNLEARAAQVRKKLISRVVVSNEEIAAWALFVASLFLRTRKVRAQVSSRVAAEVAAQFRSAEGLREIQYEFLKRGALVELAEMRRHVDERLDKILKETAFLHLSGFHTTVPNLAFSICQKAWHILGAGDDHRFVTSDCPVFTAQIRNRQLFLGYGLDIPRVSVFLAIDPNHLFVATPPGSTCSALLSGGDVDLINLATVKYAHREVYADRESKGLQEIVNQNLNQIEFGKDAYVPTRGVSRS